MNQIFILFFLLLAILCNAQNKEIDRIREQADSLILKKEYQQAVSIYTESIKNYKDNSQLLRERGIIYFILKEYKKAIEDFTAIIQLNHDSVSFAYFHRGVSRLSLNVGQISLSCADLLKAKELGYEANWNDFSMICPSLN